MTVKDYIYIIVAGFIFGVGCYTGFNCHKCPVVSSSVTIKYDTLPAVHDTTYREIPVTVVPQLSLKKIIEPVIKTNVPDTQKFVQCTTYCYDALQTQSDSAVIGIHVCSAILPQTKPPDWSMSLNYQAPPKIEKIITIIDTIILPAKHWHIGIIIGPGFGWMNSKYGLSLGATIGPVYTF